MVRESGQLYTIEGIAAGILMITTAYLVLSATSIFTPGESHISDLQLEQLGNDLLEIMDTPVNASTNSSLEKYIHTGNTSEFSTEFTTLANKTSNDWLVDDLKFNATVFYRTSADNTIHSYHFNKSPVAITGREHSVVVTRRVYINETDGLAPPPGIVQNPVPDGRSQSVLLEVMLWRD